MEQDFTIDRSKFKTETGRKLYDILSSIEDSQVIVYEIMSTVLGDKKRKEMIRCIEELKVTDIDDLMRIAFILNGRPD